MLNAQFMSGFWKIKSGKIRLEDGRWMDEQIYGGCMAFSESEVCLFVRSSEGPFGYTGPYVVDGDKIFITPVGALNPEYEKKPIERKIDRISNEHIQLSGIDDATGRYFEMQLYR